MQLHISETYYVTSQTANEQRSSSFRCVYIAALQITVLQSFSQLDKFSEITYVTPDKLLLGVWSSYVQSFKKTKYKRLHHYGKFRLSNKSHAILQEQVPTFC